MPVKLVRKLDVRKAFQAVRLLTEELAGTFPNDWRKPFSQCHWKI
jgi:hypothetical protein